VGHETVSTKILSRTTSKPVVFVLPFSKSYYDKITEDLDTNICIGFQSSNYTKREMKSTKVDVPTLEKTRRVFDK